ncbi:hypothetical protein AVEN_127956-2-1, partial [Araneus ventricosus]
ILLSFRFSALLPQKGCGGLMVRRRLRSRRVRGSKPDSTEDPPCLRACCALNYTYGANVLQLGCCGRLEKGLQLRRPPRDQNYEICSKLALALLQNGTLI